MAFEYEGVILTGTKDDEKRSVEIEALVEYFNDNILEDAFDQFKELEDKKDSNIKKLITSVFNPVYAEWSGEIGKSDLSSKRKKHAQNLLLVATALFKNSLEESLKAERDRLEKESLQATPDPTEDTTNTETQGGQENDSQEEEEKDAGSFMKRMGKLRGMRKSVKEEDPNSADSDGEEHQISDADAKGQFFEQEHGRGRARTGSLG